MILLCTCRSSFRIASRQLSHTFRRAISQLAVDQLLARPVQSYVSTSTDPFLNLSIEHYLLQHSPPDSTVLFLYINRPCVVIGRNQNPWLEVNLPYLYGLTGTSEQTDLVRRRSGGGTVYHDHGNVNWTFISPPKTFTRDKHVELVVRALRDCGIDRARVNERHDVVLDQGHSTTKHDPEDTHTTAYGHDGGRPLKVSGSAYKLTRTRALHHGTCLLNSPNLSRISKYLRSPVKQNITAKGVESVSSPVDNIGLANDDFMQAVRRRFAQVYSNSELDSDEVGDDWSSVEKVKEGLDEMKSLSWTYLQTPQFTVKKADGPVHLELDVRNGVISSSKLLLGQGSDSIKDELATQPLHEIYDWRQVFESTPAFSNQLSKLGSVIAWLNTHFLGVKQ